MKGIKQRLLKGETLFGCWLNTGSALTAEIVGAAGFDWVLVDLEHGAGTEKDALQQLQALECGTAAAVVRVESGVRQRIQRALDCGAEGVMIPRIDQPDEAKEAVAALRYPPLGTRGVARMVRASGFGRDFDRYHREAQEDILGVIQVETNECLKHVDEIASIDGVDVLFVGPADLSLALGFSGKLDDPRFVDAARVTAEAAGRFGKAAGILLSDPAQAGAFHALGFRLIACGADSAFVAAGARSVVEALGLSAGRSRDT
jgi:4-hydroxy-2-oxoheptanedioate aldolase